MDIGQSNVLNGHLQRIHTELSGNRRALERVAVALEALVKVQQAKS
jgi:hypothetical protein